MNTGGRAQHPRRPWNSIPRMNRRLASSPGFWRPAPTQKFATARRPSSWRPAACEITGRTDAACLDTLAAAYAEIGDFQGAVRVQTEAITKLSPGDPELAGFRARLRLYETGKPYREEPGRAALAGLAAGFGRAKLLLSRMARRVLGGRSSC